MACKTSGVRDPLNNAVGKLLVQLFEVFLVRVFSAEE